MSTLLKIKDQIVMLHRKTGSNSTQKLALKFCIICIYKYHFALNELFIVWILRISGFSLIFSLSAVVAGIF